MKRDMRKKLSGMAALLLLACTLLSIVWKLPVIVDKEIQYEVTGVSGVIEDQTEIEYIVAMQEDLYGMKLLVGTYEKKIENGILTVEVYDYESGAKLSEVDIAAKEMLDNQFVRADTGRLKVKGAKLRVVISGSGFLDGERISLWLGKSDLDEGAVTYIDGHRVADNILAVPCVTVGISFTWEFLLMTAVAALVFVMQWEKDPEWRK